MARVYATETLSAPAVATAPKESGYLPGILALVFIAGALFLSLHRLNPPDSLPANAPLAEFSSARALKHVENIARNPHPVGSIEHGVVRDYILRELESMGLRPETQDTTSVNQLRDGTIAAGTVSNILVRLKGTGSGATVMLTGHYDSVPTGPGASDDGSGVATLLETARALTAGSPLKNDVIFLFTDGEEVGLLGAKAFVDENPAAKDVRLVLNFEARGNGGPAIMFETSAGNGKLIREFAQASARPLANSLSYEIYKRLPNDTDLTVFKEAGLAGMNFAFINGLARYHTQADNIENLDERSLQHQGLYALGLTRHFGDLDLTDLKESNEVYFDLLSLFVLHYPVAWVLPLTGLAALLFIAVIVFGLKRKRLTLAGMAAGFLFLLSSMIAAALTVTIIWSLVLALHSSYGHIPQGDTYNSALYLLSFVALTVAVMSAIYAVFSAKTSWQNLLAGGLIWWALLMVLTGLMLPGASYLLTWPLLFILPALAFIFAAAERPLLSGKSLVVLTTCAIPGLLLLAPTISTMLKALPLSAAGAAMILLVLLLALVLPSLHRIAARKRCLLSLSALAVGVVCLVAGSVTGGFDKRHPEPSDLFYGLNADTGKAFWGSSDRPDAWTTQFLTSHPEKAPLQELFPLSQRAYMKTEAQVVALDAPNVTLLDNITENNVRTLRLRVTSRRKAPFLFIQTEANTEILGALINGRKVQPGNHDAIAAGPRNGWSLRYYGLPEEGIELSLQTKASQALKLEVVDQTYGLPLALLKDHTSRPDYMMPAPFGFSFYSDSTLVGKSFAF
jgi:hypothetical protein